MKEKRRRGCWSRIAIVAMTFFTIVVCVVAIVYVSTGLGSAAGEYQSSRQAAQDAGLCFTDADVMRLLKVPEDENGAGLLAQAKFPKIPYYDQMSYAEVKANWGLIEPGLLKLEAAMERKHIVTIKSPADLDAMTSLSDRRGWAKLLVHMASLEEKRGDLTSTERYLSVAAKIATSMSDDKTLIAIMVRLAMAQTVEARLQKILPKHANDMRWLDMIGRVLEKLDRPYDLQSALNIEHSEQIKFLAVVDKGRSTLLDIIRNNPLPTDSAAIRFHQYLPRFYEASLARLHDRYAGVVQRLPTDPYDYFGMQKSIDFDDEFALRKGWSYDFVHEYVPGSFGRIVLSVKKENTQRNALFQAVGILRTKADPRTGLPLKGRFSLDVDNKPLRLKRLDKGWIIYSIWSDEVDDGGVSQKNGHMADWVVHLSAATAPPEPTPVPRPTEAAGVPPRGVAP